MTTATHLYVVPDLPAPTGNPDGPATVSSAAHLLHGMLTRARFHHSLATAQTDQSFWAGQITGLEIATTALQAIPANPAAARVVPRTPVPLLDLDGTAAAADLDRTWQAHRTVDEAIDIAGYYLDPDIAEELVAALHDHGVLSNHQGAQ